MLLCRPRTSTLAEPYADTQPKAWPKPSQDQPQATPAQHQAGPVAQPEAGSNLRTYPDGPDRPLLVHELLCLQQHPLHSLHRGRQPRCVCNAIFLSQKYLGCSIMRNTRPV